VIFQKKEVIETYSVEECGSCKKTSKRKFKEGDYVFKTNVCSKCEAQSTIIKIFGESL